MCDYEWNFEPRRNNVVEKMFDDLFDFEYDDPLETDVCIDDFVMTDAEKYEWYKERLADQLAVWYEGERESVEKFVRDYEKNQD